MATTSNLSNKAMLVSLSISYWTGKASDERVIDEISKKHSAEKNAHEYHKLLVDPAAINAVKAARSRARTYHFDKTLPWIDGGTRILPSALYFEYSKAMHDFKGEYETAVAAFLKSYSKLKGEARKRLGSLYRDEDYPRPETLIRKFGWSMDVFPIPDKADWRVDLGGKAEAEIKKQIDDRIKAATEVAVRDLWNRLHDAVAPLAEKMKEVDPTFRNSLIGNIKEIVGVMGKMNITGDSDLTAMAKKIEADLSKLNPEELRDDPKLRKKAADAADEILKKMAGYIGKE